MSEKLLPCPFCGGEAAVCDIKKPSVKGWVGCQTCRCFIDWVKDGKSLAISAWNRRAQPENEPHNNEPLTRCENCTRWDKSITFMGAHACAYWSPSRKEPRYTEWFEFCSFAEAKA